MNVMMALPWLPYPPMDGDSVRHYNLIKRLASACDISLVCFASPDNMGVGIAEMKRYCRDIRAVCHASRSKFQWALTYSRSLIGGIPMFAAAHYLPEIRREALALMRERKFDIVQIEHTHLAQLLKDAILYTKAHTILTIHNVERIKTQRISEFEPWGKTKIMNRIDSVLFRRFEPKMIRKAERCVTVSQANADILRDIRDDIVVVENGVDISANTPVTGNEDSLEMLFLGGMNYEPNIDGALYMVDSVLPIILNKIPAATLNVVGRKPDTRVLVLERSDSVQVCWDAPEVRPWYERSAVSVVPLRSGGGTRLKILESMAFGVPVVSTSIGCEGLDVTDGEDILIADTAEEFANAACRLLEDKGLRAMVAANARALVERRYGWDAIAPKLLDVYRSLVSN